ncbi:hypothetical protein AWB85_25315 [Mycobacteroides immunogenum]|uniref:Uncharacterized protein n=1 Tax=Mycobacteroides immunogenum TaxID=83262 RepID=A0A179VBQ2_9MYCO|nr:hypothetical protein [Mycobacteroides immunogenum]OAT68423.1 hypothetical protein AWB85_25315 [Mycobacteroides immunogenum]
MRASVWWRHIPAVLVLGLLPAIWCDPDTVADVLLLVAALAGWTFTVTYLARSAWWVRAVGRGLVAACLALSLVLSQNAVSAWWGEDYPWRAHIRGLLYAGLAYALIRLTFALRRIQDRK